MQCNICVIPNSTGHARVEQTEMEACKVDNSLSLAIWKGNSGNGLELVTKQNGSPSLERYKLVNLVRTRRSKCIKNNGKTTILLACTKDVSAKESIHNSNIENCNCIILAIACDMVKDCKVIGISFRESNHEVVSLVVRILKNED